MQVVLHIIFLCLVVWNVPAMLGGTSTKPSTNVSSLPAAQSEGSTAKDDLTSAEITSLPTLPESSLCSPLVTEQTVMLEGMDGKITCGFPLDDRKSRSLVWRLRPKAGGHGLVLRFHHFNSSGLVDFAVYGGDTGSDGLSFSKEEEYRTSLAPILVAHRETLIELEGRACRPLIFCRTFRDMVFSFSVSYTAHPLKEMPVTTSFRPLTEVGLTAQVIYNCSFPYSVPKGFECDMVQQCVDGEDEPPTCPNNSEGCPRGWLPHGDQCFKMVFTDRRSTQNQGLHLASPRQLCRANFDAEPAVFPSQEGRQLVNTLYRRSGRTPQIDSHISVGLAKTRPLSDKLSHLYRFVWQWGGAGGPIAFQEVVFQALAASSDCAALFIYKELASLQGHACTMHDSEGYVCMKPNTRKITVKVSKEGLSLPRSSRSVQGFRTKTCSDGAVVQLFYPCPTDNKDSPDSWSVSEIPLFQCSVGHRVHYSLLCDGKPDCVDGSDEMNCADAMVLSSLGDPNPLEAESFQRVWSAETNISSLSDRFFTCTKMQLVPSVSRCNGVKDCFDESDEERCEYCNGPMVRCSNFGCVPQNYSETLDPCDTDNNPGRILRINYPPPAIAELDGFGFSYLSPLQDNESCPETHFQCRDGYCIPTYLINNGEQDCLLGEDESVMKDNFTCPGFYRCYESGNCLHPDKVCDGVYHCPNKDDELYCHVACPLTCMCEGYAFTCTSMFDPLQYPLVRYLDLSGAANYPSLRDVQFMPFLHFLNLSSCGLTNVTLAQMPLLQILDLSSNDIRGFESIILESLSGLRYLDISNNPIAKELGHTFMDFVMHSQMLVLQTLKMRNTGLQFINSSVFTHMRELESLDLRDNQIVSFEKDLFQGLQSLQVLQADDARLCCDLFHQDTKLVECVAPVDELSSCSDLLRSDFFRVSLWVMAMLAVTGNAGVLVYRFLLDKESTSVVYKVLIINLSLSDLLMGVYMTVIGVADVQFRGDYVSKSADWKQSGVCRMAGAFAVMSREVSAFAICLITVDRFLALRFPFGSRLRLTKTSSIAACTATWLLGLLLAVVPLFVTHWDFYEQTGICIPLPITRQNFPGQDYSLAVFIILNFVLFLLTGLGQVMIFCTVRSSGKATKQDNRKKEVTLARRLFLIVFTDFCCWFPIGVMGLLAFRGTPIPGAMTTWVAIFVLPLNSALNPHLYTLNMLKERQVKNRRKKRIEKMTSNLHAELRTWPRDKVGELVQHCLRSHFVDKTTVLQWLDMGGKDPNSCEVEKEPSSGPVTSQTSDGFRNEKI